MPERHLLYYSTVHPCAAKGTAIIVKKETHTVHIFSSVTHFQLRLQSAEEVVDTGIPLSASRCWPKTQAQSSYVPSKREFMVIPKQQNDIDILCGCICVLEHDNANVDTAGKLRYVLGHTPLCQRFRQYCTTACIVAAGTIDTGVGLGLIRNGSQSP